MRDIEKFLLELGAGFTFIARQKRIQIDNDDFYIDLLFYNRKLKRLVAIDLKLGNFRHEYKSQAVSMSPNTSPYYHPKNYFKQNSNKRSLRHVGDYLHQNRIKWQLVGRAYRPLRGRYALWFWFLIMPNYLVIFKLGLDLQKDA
nr:DUF1016 domain-containing protein [Pseudanabaena sp. UWO310]